MNNEMTTDNMPTEEIIDILKGIVFNGFDRTTSKERQALHLAIKALEERPQGEWIDEGQFAEGYNEHAYACKNCGYHIIEKPNMIFENRFCKYCGAKMKGGEEE